MRVTEIHFEASSYCNARCPGCPRNYQGYPIPRNKLYEENHLDVDVYKDIISRYPYLNRILFCGNHGDPMMHPSIVTLCNIPNIGITIATNGAAGLLNSYKELAELGVRIRFGIDGLENTNHLYRQDVNWNKLMDRVKCFIDAGGEAEWQFIKFKHNMHQVEEAKEYSKQLGFTSFIIEDRGRNNFPARDLTGKVTHWILPPDPDAEPNDKFYEVVDESIIDSRIRHFELNKLVLKMHCETLEQNRIYVNSSGEIFPCCYHGFGHSGHPKIYLEDFEELKEGWFTGNCNEICAEYCGEGETQ